MKPFEGRGRTSVIIYMSTDSERSWMLPVHIYSMREIAILSPWVEMFSFPLQTWRLFSKLDMFEIDRTQLDPFFPNKRKKN